MEFDDTYSMQIKFKLPQKYKKCNLTSANFWFQGNDAVAFLKGHTFSSVNEVNQNLIKNWANDSSSRNCYSSVLQNFGKWDSASHAEYASWTHGYVCSGDFTNTYKNNNANYSVLVKDSMDGENTLINEVISFTYIKSNETCNGTDDDCDGEVDEGCPFGFLDSTWACESGGSGWSRDSRNADGSAINNDSPDTSNTLKVKLYYVQGTGTVSEDATKFIGELTANQSSADVGAHRFTTQIIIPNATIGQQYTIAGWGQNSGIKSSGNVQLSTPKTLTVTQETCDGKDNDCDGQIDDGFECIKDSSGCTSSCTIIPTYQSCTGTLPTQVNGMTRGPTTYLTGSSTTSWTYSNSATTNSSCLWKCDLGYIKQSNTCVLAVCTGSAPENFVLCSSDNIDLVDNTAITLVNSCTQNTKCEYTCTSGYHYDNGACTSNTKTSSCTLSTSILPENAQWNDDSLNGIFNQTWVNSAWSPSTKNAFYSELPGECAYSCKLQQKYCQLDPTIYCGNGIQLCSQGYWGSCSQGDSIICSKNQYCDANSKECKFCSDGKKNCDANLSNGCETDTTSDPNNCGSCGNTCAAGICLNGSCNTTVTDTNLCKTKVCGQNSACNSLNGACVCSDGYNDCDSLSSNGCEKLGSCNQITPPLNTCTNGVDCNSTYACQNNVCVKKECVSDSECLTNQKCENSKCVTQTVGKTFCVLHEHCPTGYNCINSYCEEQKCATNFVLKDRTCVCELNSCGKECHPESGSCCNGVWNAGVEFCSINFDEQIDEVTSGTDVQAQQLIQLAKTAQKNGEISKAKTLALLAQMKNRISASHSESKYNSTYEDAQNYYEQGNYTDAQNIAAEVISELPAPSAKEENGILLIVVVVIALLAGAFILFNKFKKKLSKTDSD
jgi:hypothetical protein